MKSGNRFNSIIIKIGNDLSLSDRKVSKGRQKRVLRSEFNNSREERFRKTFQIVKNLRGILQSEPVSSESQRTLDFPGGGVRSLVVEAVMPRVGQLSCHQKSHLIHVRAFLPYVLIHFGTIIAAIPVACRLFASEIH